VLSSLPRIPHRRVAGEWTSVSFPRDINRADLEWVVEIPDFENVVMDAGNAIAQRMPLKENVFT
jgi:hypothetical protein